jgi:hypothetical protein
LVSSMPTSKQARKIIAADEVSRVFHADCIEELARLCQLPITADKSRFGEGVREAARILAQDARKPKVNQVHDEIAALWKAVDPAKPPQWEAMAIALRALSPRTREMLADRGRWPHVAGSLPTPESVRDPKRREAAREVIARLCSMGGKEVEGRLRPGGKRSRQTWRPVLYAPDKQARFDKRKAERDFVMWLQIAWCEAVGEKPAQTARHADSSRKLGPFARMARECLRLVGASDADVVELIKELQRRRSEMERQHCKCEVQSE